MRKALYWTGRCLQLAGLLLLPSAIWVTEFARSEAGALAILFGAMAIFFFGWLLTRIR